MLVTAACVFIDLYYYIALLTLTAWSRVYVTVGCPSICPFVCAVDRKQQQHAAGLLLSALRHKISIDGCWRWRRVPAVDRYLLPAER